LRVAITNLVRGRYNGQSLEESVVSLVRALDGLCEHYGLARQNLLARLDADQQKLVKEALGAAVKKISEQPECGRNPYHDRRKDPQRSNAVGAPA
jgi:hypothetical protein